MRRRVRMMFRSHRRGSALATALIALMFVLTAGAGLLSLSLQSMRRGRFDVRSLVTDVVDAADVASLFARLDRGDPGVLPAVLRFPAAPEAW